MWEAQAGRTKDFNRSIGGEARLGETIFNIRFSFSASDIGLYIFRLVSASKAHRLN